MSSSSDLAAALVRILPQNAISRSMQGLLENAFNNLDRSMTQISANAGLDALASVLIPSGAPSERNMQDVADRMIACLPLEGMLLGGLLGSDSVGRGALDQLKNLWNFESSAGSRQVSTVDVSQKLNDAFQGIGAQGQAMLQLHDDLSLMTADIMQSLSVAAPGWTSSGVRDLIIRQLNKWINSIRGLGGIAKKTSVVMEEILFELKFRYPVRLTVASILSVGAHLLIGEKELLNDLKELVRERPSSSGLGANIHRTYQKDYRERRLADLIEQEDLVYGLSVQSFQGRRLADVAFIDKHLELTAMYLARQSLKPIDRALAGAPPVEKMLNWSIRDDNTNFTETCLFEIKPVRSAWLGVVQEMYYRSSFNMWMAICQDFSSFPVAVAKKLGMSPGAQGFVCERLRPGVAADWPEVNSARRAVRPIVQNGTVFAVMATSVDALPGLVLYWIFDFPVWAIKLIYDDLRDAFNALTTRVQRIVIEAFTWITAIVIAIVAVALLIILVVSAEAEIGALIPILARLGIGLPATVLAGLASFRQALQSLSNQWAVTAAGDASSGFIRMRFTPETSIPNTVLMTGIQVGFLQIEEIPVDAAKHFGAVIQAGLAMTQAVAPGVA